MEIKLLENIRTSLGMMKPGIVSLPAVEARKLILSGKAIAAPSPRNVPMSSMPNRMIKAVVTR